MRMWMIEPSLMCRKHLLGEHVEIHMLVGSLLHHRNISGHLERGQLEPQNAQPRHEELAQEMLKRGYKHNSPLPSVEHRHVGTVDRNVSIQDLIARCPECAKRIKEKYTQLNT